MVQKRVAIAPEKMGPVPIYFQGFALLSFEEEPCPLSLSHGFFTYTAFAKQGSQAIS